MACNCKSLGTCGTSVPIEVLRKAKYVRNKVTGCVYENVQLTSVAYANCDDYEPVETCGMQLTEDQIEQMSISLDNCGKPAKNLITFACQ